MSLSLVAAIVALTAHLAAWRVGVRSMSWLAVLVTLVAIGWRMPAVGAAPIGLAAALGLGIAATRVGAHHMHLLAAAATLPAAIFASAPQPLGWMSFTSVALGSCLVASCAAATAIHAEHMTTRQRALLALVVLSAPVPLLPVTPMAAVAEFPLGVQPVAALHRGVMRLDPTQLPAWTSHLWLALPWVGAVAVGIAWVLGRRAIVAVGVIWLAAVAAATVGSWPVAASWLSGESTVLLSDPRSFPLASPVTGVVRQLDAGALVLLLVRGGIAMALLRAVPAPQAHHPQSAWPDLVTAVLGATAVAFWSWAAPGYLGPTWMLDPAVAAVIACTVAAFATLRWPSGITGATLRSAQLVGAGVILGGADVGWRVASALMGA